MKCETCEHKHGYTLGFDECGAGNPCVYCSKGHWNDGGPQDQEEYERQKNPDPWINCKDYKQLAV